MSRISKRKLWKILKHKEEKKPEPSVFMFSNQPITQEEWLKGYHKWVKKNNANN
jgi:hypothetical protein